MVPLGRVASAAPTPFDKGAGNPATTLAQWRGFPLGAEGPYRLPVVVGVVL
jgi:hypothetical protein